MGSASQVVLRVKGSHVGRAHGVVPGRVSCSFISGHYYRAASHTYGMYPLIIIFTIILMTMMMIKCIKLYLKRSF